MVPPSSSPARIPDWEQEGGGGKHTLAPGLVPSHCRLGGHRLLLASLTGSERRGDSVPGARPRAVAPSSRRMSSPARIHDWEREEGRLRPWRPALCSVPNRSRIQSVEQDVPLDFLQDPWRGIKDIPQICTARGGKR